MNPSSIAASILFTLLLCISATLQADPVETTPEAESIASQQLKKLDHAFSPTSTNSEASIKQDLTDSRMHQAQDMMDAIQGMTTTNSNSTNAPKKP